MNIKTQNWIVIVFVLIFTIAQTPKYSFSQPKTIDVNPKKLKNKLHRLIREKKADGCDVSTAIDLDRRSKEAFRAGDSNKGLRLLKKAVITVRELTPMNKTKTVANNDTGISKPEKVTDFRITKVHIGSRKTKKVELFISANEVIYTVAVPKPEYERGNQIKDFGTTFTSETLKAVEGKFKLQLDDRPVFLEVIADANVVSNSKETLSKDSPFGLHGISKYNKGVADLGISIVRFAGRNAIVWDVIEPRSGKFVWDRHDKVFFSTHKGDVATLANLKGANSWDQGTKKGSRPAQKLPVNLDKFSQFVTKVVERYDGDGFNDAPGSPVVEYWQIENEVDNAGFWKDSPRNYAEELKVAYKAVKAANPNAKVVIAGLWTPAGLDFFDAILKRLNAIKDSPKDVFFDVFDFHKTGTAAGYKQVDVRQTGKLRDFDTYVTEIREMLGKYGYSHVPIWITEISTYSDSPVSRDGTKAKNQTECEQAVGLLKNYIYSLSLGIEKMFWVSMVESHCYAGRFNGYYDNVGLVHSPRNEDGQRGKKLAFYTYKLLIEKTRGAQWSNIEKLNTDGQKDVYLFKVMRSGSPFYIVWWDYNSP